MSCAETEVFPLAWKMVNINLTHKKGIRWPVKNYRQISLLPNCGQNLNR